MTHAERADQALGELVAREPIFHRPEFAATNEDFAALMSENYWEVGASGAVYTREFILDHLAQKPPLDAAEAGWMVEAPRCRWLSQDTYLLTYTLHQGERETRRATLWRRTESGWQIIYHQGTVVAAERSASG